MEDRDVGIFYISTKFEFDRSTNNRDLLSERNHITEITDSHIYTQLLCRLFNQITRFFIQRFQKLIDNDQSTFIS